MEQEELGVDENQGYVLIANEILRKCKINGQVESLVQCSDSFFVAVYEGILGEALQGVIPDAVSHDDKVVNCSIVIDALSCDVLNVDLSHITGQDIVEGDVTGVQNLLEIFKELLDFILDVDETPPSYDEDEQNDSDLLSSDHEVISNVLKEELGSSYESISTQRKLPRNENLRKQSKFMSSHGSVIDADISMIPKWSRSLDSSRSSGCDSNSTGEIIRESELLECQLAREYPSLHKLREENGLGSHDRLDEAQELEIGNDSARALTPVVKKTSLDTRQPIKPSTTNRLSPVKSAKRPHIKDHVGLQTKDIKEKRDNMVIGVENQLSRDRRESQVEFKESRILTDKRILCDGDETTEQLSTIGDMRGVRNRQSCVGHSKLNIHSKISSGKVGEPDRIVKCSTLQVESEMGSQDADTRPDVRLKDKTMKNKHDDKNRLQLQSDKFLDTLGKRNSGKPRDKRRALEQLRISEESNAPRLDHDFVATRNSEIAEDPVKFKLRSRALGGSRVEEEQRGSRSRNDNGKGVFKDNNEHDGSDTSGILWDDQISPLDASEALKKLGTGLAFEEIGMKRMVRQKKEMNKGVEESQDRNLHRSPIFHHYHHHFHHPSGSSEDLQQDLEYAVRVEAPEDQRQRTGRKNIGQRSLDKRKERSSRKDEISGKRCVKFNDNVDMLLITSRLERLKREMERDEKEHGDRRHVIKSSYGGHLNSLNKEHKKMENELKQRPKVLTNASPRRTKRSVPGVSRDRAQAVYSKPTKCRRARFPSSKARKRSTSASPKVHQKKKTTKQLEKGDILLPTMLDEFPFLHLSPPTLQTMRKKQTQQLLTLSKSASESGQTKTQKVLEDAEKRQQTLLKILRKDLLHNQRMREQKERKEQERVIKSKLRDKRHASARARRYYEDYQLRMRSKLLKRRTREEQIFKNLFQDGLEIQKQRVQEIRTYAKEQREVRAVRQQNELESLENYYRDQYSILAEAIAHEKETLQVREKAQEKVIQEMQRNLRVKLQREVADIQETLVRDEDDAYFRRLDAERLRRQMQMTAFQNLS